MKINLIPFLMSLSLVITSSTIQANDRENEEGFKLKQRIENGNYPAWMMNRISQDLAHFNNTGITKEMLDNIMNSPFNLYLVRYQILNGKLIIKEKFSHLDGYVNVLTNVFTELTSYISLPDIEFIVYSADSYSGFSNVFPEGPMLAYSKGEFNDLRVLLIPDPAVLASQDLLISQVNEGRKKYPWETKEAKVFWRGMSSGGPYKKESYMKLPRIRIVELSRQFPHLINAKLTCLEDMDEYVKSKCLELNYLGSTEPIINHLAYKYQILIDGHAASWSRAYWQLYCNCLMFKQHSSNIQWYYGQLHPYIHYIPLKSDISDLLEKLQWAQENDQEVQNIIKNANKFANENLQYNDMLIYFYLLFMEYAKLQRF